MFLQILNFWYFLSYLVKINMFNFSLQDFGGGGGGGGEEESVPLLKMNWDISTKPKGIETSGASAEGSALLCTDRLAAVEEVTSLVNMTSWRSSFG